MKTMNVRKITGELGKLGNTAQSTSITDGILPSFATPYTQNARLLKLQLCEGGQLNERLPAQKAEGEEALSTLYRYEITCKSPETGIKLKTLLGLPAQIGILTAQAGGR
ncbi:MAG: phage late control D family protein, partial [Azoarcus sp.]|nr:phage late control D family protein [Azoarcus sp.]